MMSSVQKKVVEAVDKHRDSAIDFLRSLLKVPSVTGKEKEVQGIIVAKYNEIGLKVDMWDLDPDQLAKAPEYVETGHSYRGRPNLVGLLKGMGGGRSLVLNGHVDVIPPEPREAWDIDPWGAEIREGKIFGRGASDMKSGIATMVMAVENIIKAGVKLKGDVIIETVIDEEYSSNGTLGCILRGYKGDAGISCEASDLEIQPSATGSMWFEITVQGRSASMSRIWEAVSAVDKGYRIAQAVKEYQEIRLSEKTHPLYKDPRAALACFVGMFNAGTYPSSSPDVCVIKGRIGLLPSENPLRVQQNFIDYIRKVSDSDPWLKDHQPEVYFKGYRGEPAEIPVEHPINNTLKRCFKDVTGKEPVVKGHEGATDARVLIKYGIPTTIFGPGTITQMHATNEWVKVDNFVDAMKVLATAITDWCGCR